MNRLNKILLIILLPLIMGSTGCGDDITFKYQVPMQVDFVVPLERVNQFTQLTVKINNIPTRFEDFLSLNNTLVSEVTAVSAGKAVLQSAFQNVDMGFIRDISVRVVSRADPSLIKELFFLNDFRFDEGVDVELFGSVTDAVDIMTEPTVDIHVVLNFQSFPPGDVDMQLDFSYLVFDE